MDGGIIQPGFSFLAFENHISFYYQSHNFDQFLLFSFTFFFKFYFIMFCMRSTGISQEGSTGTTTIFHGLHHFFEKGINTWRNTHNPHERTPRTISLQNGSRCQIFGAHNQQAFWTCSMEIGEEPAVIFT